MVHLEHLPHIPVVVVALARVIVKCIHKPEHLELLLFEFVRSHLLVGDLLFLELCVHDQAETRLHSILNLEAAGDQLLLDAQKSLDTHVYNCGVALPDNLRLAVSLRTFLFACKTMPGTGFAGSFVVLVIDIDSNHSFLWHFDGRAGMARHRHSCVAAFTEAAYS